MEMVMLEVVGAIFNNYSDIHLINCILTNNEINYAASIYNAANTRLILINTNFTNNTARNFGGAIYFAGDNMTIVNSSFVNNTSNFQVLSILMVII